MTNPMSNNLRVIRTNQTDPDPALNLATDEENIKRLSKYMIERDPETAPLVEGATPVWFHIKRLPAAYLNGVIDGIFGKAAQYEHAFRAAVHVVEIPGEAALQTTPKKSAVRGTPFLSTEAAHGVQLAGADWTQEIADRWSDDTVMEMGRTAIDLSRLPKGRRGPFSGWGGTVASP